MTSNDAPWAHIFEQLKILEALNKSPFYSITAKQINDIGKREARLMAKFDTKESLPQIFNKAELNINAVSNGNYIIFKDPSHRSFITLPDYKNIIPEKFSPILDFDLQTLSFNTRMSESNAIDYAHHSKMLTRFSGEKELKLTTRGRFFSDSFKFQLGAIGNIDVKGVQIEVDAGYEGHEQFLIIEAKSSTRASFNIRQLYYPYRHFQNKTSKKIRTLLLSFSNGIYYFTEIELTSDYYGYNIINNSAFEVIIDTSPEKVSIAELLSQKTYTPDKIPVPQADDLNKIMDLINFLTVAPADKFSIAEYFEFDDRQGDYYGNAACYIGLIEKEGALFKLTPTGQELSLIKNRKKRNIHLVKAILKIKLFNDLLKIYIEQDGNIDDQQIITRIEQEGLKGTTPARRKSTVKSWIHWVVVNIN